MTIRAAAGLPRVMGGLGDIVNAPEAIQKRALDELRKAGWGRGCRAARRS